jgi:hypothetical protein
MNWIELKSLFEILEVHHATAIINNNRKTVFCVAFKCELWIKVEAEYKYLWQKETLHSGLASFSIPKHLWI